MGQNLTGQTIASTYEDLVQISGSILTDGLGANIDSLQVTASYATFAENVVPVDTGSFVTTASTSDATTTFTKGDGSTFNTTVNNVVNATSSSFANTASFALNFNPAATASYALFAVSSSRAEFAGDSDNLDGNDGTYYRNASNINAGTLPTARLSGTYTINITGSVNGNASTAVSASFATNANFATTASFVSGAIATASYAANADLLDGQDGTFYRNADNINAGTLGTGRLAGTYAIDISGDANTLDGNDGTFYRNADNINAGTLNVNRLAGTYTIDIAGGAATATSASFASTIANGLDINANNITASNGLFTNLVATSASFAYTRTTTGSAVIIGDEFIILNADTPAARYAGIMVYDTGSSATASFEWDGNNDYWITVEENGDSAVILTGPSGSKGTEVLPTVNTIQKGGGQQTLVNSNITDNGTLVTINSNVSASGFVSASEFIGNLTGTATNATNATSASFATTAVSASFATSASFAATANSSSYALTASFAENSIPAFPFNGDAIISGSLGLTGSFSSFPIAVTAAAGTASVSGYTGSIFSVDATKGNTFEIALTTLTSSVLDVVNMKPGQEIYVRVSQSADGVGSGAASSNLQLNSNIYVPTGSARYLPSVATGSVDQLTITYTDKLLCEYEKQFVTFSIESPAGFVSASGGTVTTDGDYKIHTFTASGDFNVSIGGDISEYLIVAGGGGGGRANAGGGGAGGYFATGSDTDIVNVVTSGIYSVVVGAGGAGGTSNTGSLGSDSSVFGITTYGGGGGGSINGSAIQYDGVTGGSGGGGANNGSSVGAGGIPTSGSVAAALGFVGGAPSPNASGPGGGGGGAGGAGATNSGNNGGAGGAGVTNDITGASLFYAGGGGGGSNSTGGAGGSSVGGNGGSGAAVGANGATNRGSGGGGGAGGSANGGNGSAGVVIIRYKFQ